jgi:hypothetical protein
VGGPAQTPSKLSIGRGSRPKIGERPRESQIRFHQVAKSSFGLGTFFRRGKSQRNHAKTPEIVQSEDDFRSSDQSRHFDVLSGQEISRTELSAHPHDSEIAWESKLSIIASSRVIFISLSRLIGFFGVESRITNLGSFVARACPGRPS